MQSAVTGCSQNVKTLMSMNFVAWFVKDNIIDGGPLPQESHSLISEGTNMCEVNAENRAETKWMCVKVNEKNHAVNNHDITEMVWNLPHWTQQ